MQHQMTLTQFKRDGKMLRFKTPLVIAVKKNNDWFEAKCERLGFIVSERTPRRLREEIGNWLHAAWIDYALADDSTLSHKAIILKRNILADMYIEDTKTPF